MISSMRMSIVCLMILLFVCLGCSNSIQILSHKNDNGIIKIDGLDDDWKKENMEVIKDSKIAVGIAYDENYIYLGLAPLDRGVATQMMMMGFTVWFDSTGNGKKILGIRYPIGFDGAMPMNERGQNENPFEDIMKNKLNEVEIIGPGKYDRMRLTVYELSGITVKLTTQKNGMFFELKVPLHASTNFPYAINTGVGKPLSILLETGEFKRPGFGGGMRGGGLPGGGGRMPGGNPQMGGSPEMPKPIKVHLTTTLSIR
ncbi:hypothetical protein JNM05_05200 [bacterium]|nr:hypothetical protein [bacterium]